MSLLTKNFSKLSGLIKGTRDRAIYFSMLSSNASCSRENEYCVGTVLISSVPVTVFINFAHGWKKRFITFDKFGSRNGNPLIERPIDLKYVYGNGQSISFVKIAYVEKYIYIFFVRVIFSTYSWMFKFTV